MDKVKKNINNEQYKNKNLQERYRVAKQHQEQRNKQNQQRLSNIYIDTKYERFYIFDFIKTDNRILLINNLKKFFRYDEISESQKIDLHLDRIPDLTKEGILYSTGFRFVGAVYNQEYYPNSVLHGPSRELPEFLNEIRIFIHNFDDKFFCIVYKCFMNENFKNNELKSAYIHSDDFNTIIKGNLVSNVRQYDIDEGHPIINEKIKQTVDFLSDFVDGLVINKKAFFKKETAIPPNIKVFAMKSINFSHFDKWELRHRDYLRFLDTQYPCYSRYHEIVISNQRTRSFGQGTTNAGLTFIISKWHLKPDNMYANKEAYIDAKLNEVINMILPTFYVYHKTNIITESTIAGCEFSKDEYKKRILLKRRFLGDYFYKIMNAYYIFQDLFFGEIKHIKKLRNIWEDTRYTFDFIPLLRNGYNVSEGLKKGAKELLNLEQNNLKEVKQEYESLKDLNISLTDFILQRRINWFTISVVVLTIILVGIGLLSII